jgi:excinuclease UvrABC nuclease subunit
MINLTNVDDVKALQSNLRATFDSAQGREVIAFLEQSCGWYDSIFDPKDRDLCLINDGKRQVLATIKTLLKLTPDQVVALAKEKEA